MVMERSVITLTREEAQKMLDALNTVYGAPRYEASKTLRAKLSEPEQTEYLQFSGGMHVVCKCDKCIAQPEPEPVAYLWECLGRWSAMLANDGEHADLSPPSWLCDAVETATTPPQREWQGLTDEEIVKVFDYIDFKNGWLMHFYRAIEAKLKEKNGF